MLKFDKITHRPNNAINMCEFICQCGERYIWGWAAMHKMSYVIRHGEWVCHCCSQPLFQLTPIMQVMEGKYFLYEVLPIPAETTNIASTATFGLE